MSGPADHGLPLEQELVIEAGSFDIRQAYLAVRRAADGGGAVHGPVRHLRQHGHRGHAGPCGRRAADPRDCSVIAIDGLTMSEYINPTLTTLCQPMEHMGRRSVEILLDMVEHRGGPIRETAHTTLRTGESVRDIS